MGISEISKEARTASAASGGGAGKTGRKGFGALANLLSTDNYLAVPKKKPKKIKLVKNGALGITLTESQQVPATARVLGHNYTRSFTGGNPASEAYLRNNLEAFVRGARAVLLRLLPEIYGAKAYNGPENTMKRLQDACRDPGTLLAGDYVKEDGTPLKINKAFAEAITQFFKDEAFARNVCRIAINDYLAGKETEKKAKTAAGLPMK